jgi:hypothetical protein
MIWVGSAGLPLRCSRTVAARPGIPGRAATLEALLMPYKPAFYPDDTTAQETQGELRKPSQQERLDFFTIPGLTPRLLPRPSATARKGQGSYQEVGQHQERYQIVAPISTMTGPPSAPAAASHRCRPAPGKEVTHYGRERTVRQGPSSAAGCPGR